MNVLGIESSSPVCSIGLVDGQGRTWENSVVDRHVHSDRMVGLIEQTIATAGLQMAHIDAVAISLGPGSFTGLRIGMSTAKGLCTARNLQIVGVPTFEAIGAGILESVRGAQRVMVVVDAKRDDFYIMKLERAGDGSRPLGEAAVVPARAIRSMAEGVDVVCTDRTEELREILGTQLTIVKMQQFISGARVAVLGQKRAAAGQRDSVESLEPLYLKDFIVRQL